MRLSVRLAAGYGRPAMGKGSPEEKPTGHYGRFKDNGGEEMSESRFQIFIKSTECFSLFILSCISRFKDYTPS